MTKTNRLNKSESYIIGLIIGVLISCIIGLPIFFLEIPPVIQLLTYILWSVAGALIVFGAGLRKIRERHNCIPTFLGSPVQLILNDGWMWWFPSWLGGGIMDAVSVAQQNKEVVIGSLDNGSAIYTKDGVKAEIILTLVYKIANPWTWVVEFEGSPEELISDSAERVVRWFTDAVDAEELVKLNKVLSALLKGEYHTDPNGNAQITITHHKKDGSGTETTRLDIDPDILDHTLSLQLQRFGAEIKSVMVRSIKVDHYIEQQWQARAAERAQREAELADAQTTVMLVNEIMNKAGMTREEARNMVETLRGRGTRKIYTIEGLEKVVQGAIAALAKKK